MPATASELDWLKRAAGGSVLEFYAQLGVELKDNGGEEASVRCFANPSAHNRDDRNPSCSVNLLTGLFHCKGCGESGNAYSAAIALGRPEAYARQLARSHGLFLETAPEKLKDRPKLPTERRLEIWRKALRENQPVLTRLHELKGWTPRGLFRRDIGWDGERLTFAVRNQKFKIAGLVRYLPGGSPKSLAAPGSKRDLFPPPEAIRRRRPIFLCEGEPAVISIQSCGFYAVGVPGAGAWRREWAQRLVSRRVVVLPDCDSQGRALAERVAADVPGAQVVDLEPGRDDGSDIGDWVAQASCEGGLAQVSRVLGRLATA